MKRRKFNSFVKNKLLSDSVEETLHKHKSKNNSKANKLDLNNGRVKRHGLHRLHWNAVDNVVHNRRRARERRWLLFFFFAGKQSVGIEGCALALRLERDWGRVGHT